MNSRLVLALILFCFACGPTLAQETKPKIAVIGLANPSTLHKSNLGNALVDMLTTEISRAGKYRLIERDALREILKEIHLGNENEFDAKEIVKKGGLIGTDFLVLGKISNYTYRETAYQRSEYVYPQGMVQVVYYAHVGEVRLDLRVIDVKTGEVIRSVVGHGDSQNAGQVSFQIEWNQYLAMAGEGSLSALSTLLTEAATAAIHDAVRNINDIYPALVDFMSKRSTDYDLSSISEGRIEAVLGQGNFVIGLRDTGGLKVGDHYLVQSEATIRDSAGKVVYLQRRPGGTLEVVDISQRDRAMARLLMIEGSAPTPAPREKDSITLDPDYAKKLRGAPMSPAGPIPGSDGGPSGGKSAPPDVATRIRSFLTKGDRYLSNQNYSEALEQFKSGLQLSPANPELLSREVVALAGVDNFTDAEEEAEKAISAGGSIRFPVAHNHAFGICEGDFVIEKGRVSFQPKSGPDGFLLSSGGLIDISPSIYTGTNLPEIEIRWRTPDGKERKYYMVFTSYLTRVSGGRGIPQIYRASGDAVDKTTRLDKMIIGLTQENTK